MLVPGASETEVDLDRVGSIAQAFLEERPDLSQLRATCDGEGNCASFSTEEATFTDADYKINLKIYPLEISREELLDVLVFSPPEVIWGGSSSFQLGYNHNTGKITYPGEERGAVEVGELIVLELELYLGAGMYIWRPVAFEIVRIDPEAGIFAFSYAKGGATKGLQFVKIKEENGKAKVYHGAKYCSGNEIRDDYFYVHFHEQMMDDFYERIEEHVINSRE